MREANISQNQRVESSLKAYDMSLNKLQLDNNKFFDGYFKATVYIPHDVCVFVRFESGDPFFKVHTTFTIGQAGETERRE